MNAWAPVERLPAPARAGAGKRQSAPRPLTRFAQSDSYRYRLRYTKRGPAAYMAHLDLVRHLPRIFRRAGLDIAYSHGFHPKPYLSFGPALGLGLPSLGELLDVKLSDDLGPDELLRRLNAVSLPGIDFLMAAALQQQEPALGRVLARAEYAVFLPDGQSAATGLARHASGAPLLAARRERQDSRRSGAAAPTDVRSSITDVAAATEKTARILAAKLGWVGANPGNVLTFGVVVSALGSARPVEVVEALTDPSVTSQSTIARLGLWAAVKSGESEPEPGRFVDPLAVEQRFAGQPTSKQASDG
jgi:radical SAM-linked protein